MNDEGYKEGSATEPDGSAIAHRQGQALSERSDSLRAKRVPAIYREALQAIVDTDPTALDAQGIAAKALGDANEFLNTGRVRRDPPRCLGSSRS